MNERKSRNYRRVSQACDNCRRKKIRCPGQRPSCSACSRLDQECCYKSHDSSAASRIERRMSDRLSRVEQRLDLIVGSIGPSQVAQSSQSAQSTQEVTPASTAAVQHAGSLTSPGAWSAHASLDTTPAESIDISLQVYFEHIHRQPLWVFDQESATHLETSEELMCIVLALSITCDPAKMMGADLKSPSFYASRASSLAMLQIASQQVHLQTLQCLCLVSFYHTINGDLRLAGMNITIARSVLNYLMESTSTAGIANTDLSKVFWSLTCLDAFHGPPNISPSIPGHISSPKLSILESGTVSLDGVLLPETFDPTQCASRYDDLDDIWSQSLRFCSLWQQTRIYVSKCIAGLTEAPWQPTSTYTRLCSHIMDLEEIWPRRLSYNTARFQDRSPQEIEAHRLTWLPWLKVQVMYHTVHCVMNHPFLYSLEGTKTICPTNTFWRSSFEKALRHCTWVSRLIRLAGEKGLSLTDPFFAQAAGVAGSLHLYWMRATDDAVKESASKNLRICQTLITSMAAHWPVCRSIERALNVLVDSLASSYDASGPAKSTIMGPLSVMWTLLDISAPQFPNYPGGRSQQKAVWAGSVDFRGETPAGEDGDTTTGARDLRESTARYASPPQWALSRLQDGEVAPRPVDCPGQRFTERVNADWTDPALAGTIALPQEDIILVDPTWGPLEYMMRLGDTASSSLDPWDFGNL